MAIIDPKKIVTKKFIIPEKSVTSDVIDKVQSVSDCSAKTTVLSQPIAWPFPTGKRP
ncbi:hypothetical protein [Candidatus Pandoraea novymonadis]|uniref:Uncharacterized protein n=1 Tax=Candidatus Pandoraea novymonadis TaxID=1808959 RepID=A0ABX5FGG8_9BURK|nr:hypothetical protein [Candidatus Pandoraea novymonadis]PSB92386.1 hypothetical protein BZL35_00628 [Candidatus Pandoraea novymonadis]